MRPLVCVCVAESVCRWVNVCERRRQSSSFFSSFLSIVIKLSVWCLTFLCGMRYCCSSLLRLLSKFQSQNKSHRTSTTSRTNRVCIVTPICTYVLWEGRECNSEWAWSWCSTVRWIDITALYHFIQRKIVAEIHGSMVLVANSIPLERWNNSNLNCPNSSDDIRISNEANCVFSLTHTNRLVNPGQW